MMEGNSTGKYWCGCRFPTVNHKSRRRFCTKLPFSKEIKAGFTRFFTVIFTRTIKMIQMFTQKITNLS